MTTPRDDGLLGQILVEQGKLSQQVGGLDRQLAVVAEKVSQIPDHEMRIRDHDRRIGGLEAGRRSWVRDAAMMAPMYGLVVDLIVRGIH